MDQERSSSSFAGIKWQHRASLATSPLKPPEMIPLDDPEIGDIIKGGGPRDIDIDALLGLSWPLLEPS